MANIAQMVNVLQALILTDGPRMVLTPTYWVHKMYLPMQDATFVPVTFDPATTAMATLLPGVDAVAMRDTAGKLWLSLVNLDPREARRSRSTFPDCAVAARTARC
jgi:alpha-N-arabinofuranosidase